MSEKAKPMPFTSWIFSVNFGDADLYEKHRSYMQLAYEARDKEVQFYIDQAEKLKQQLESCQSELSGISGQLKEAVELVEKLTTFEESVGYEKAEFLAKYRGEK